MKLFDVIKNDYFRLFVKREGKVVLGKNYSNLWLLTAVLTATFLAIAFSNGSLDYLSYKMDDPFINWVDIKNEYGEGDFIGLEYALDSDENKELFHYNGYQGDHYVAWMFYGREDDNVQYLKCRFFQSLNTSLVEKILEDGNIVKKWRIEDLSMIDINTIGVVITEEAMMKLGYDKAPSFIDMQRWFEGESAEDFGFHMPDEGFVRLPVPVLAVVKRLPGNVDLISGSYLYKQSENDNTYPFVLCKEMYAMNLCYFIPEEIDILKVKSVIDEAASEHTDAEIVMDDRSFYVPEIVPFRPGKFVIFDCYDQYLDFSVWGTIDRAVRSEFRDKDVHRVYKYDFSEYALSQKAFISVHFNDLHKLRDFEAYVRDNFNVNIEMSQINAKENFNAVSIMGNTLSWGIIVFAIVCIILFIVNLLQSYFQKVMRNLGTFKAFGISNRDLISVYVLIMAAIIISAIFMSVSVTWIVQGIMHICGVLKDGVHDYLSLWSYKTVSSIVIIIVAAIYTVYAVMHKLLKATPGDLIYDRQ